MIKDLSNKKPNKKLYDYERFLDSVKHHPHSKPYHHHINLITSETKAVYQIDDYIVDLDSLSKKVIICNKQTQKMVIANIIEDYDANNVMCLNLVEETSSTIELDQIIDINEEGRRWEGCSKEGKPYGYGREYDENNNLEFEGFVYEYNYLFGESKFRVGYGIEYYSDLDMMEFEGMYFFNNRFYGINYDRNGEIDLEGYQPIPTNNNTLLCDRDNEEHHYWLSCHCQTLTIPGNSFNNQSFTQFHLSSINFITSIIIGQNCFSAVNKIVFNDLPDVKTITINSNTFNNCTDITFKSMIVL